MADSLERSQRRARALQRRARALQRRARAVRVGHLARPAGAADDDLDVRRAARAPPRRAELNGGTALVDGHPRRDPAGADADPRPARVLARRPRRARRSRRCDADVSSSRRSRRSPGRSRQRGARRQGRRDCPSCSPTARNLCRVFQNLIGNAVKFTRRRRRPRSAIGAERDGRLWRFSVRDNGIGMDPEHAERIFEPFQRLHGEEDYPGTGIGLAVCERIVDQHGGRIWVSSAPGEGSTFSFTLPSPAAAPRRRDGAERSRSGALMRLAALALRPPSRCSSLGGCGGGRRRRRDDDAGQTRRRSASARRTSPSSSSSASSTAGARGQGLPRRAEGDIGSLGDHPPGAARRRARHVPRVRRRAAVGGRRASAERPRARPPPTGSRRRSRSGAGFTLLAPTPFSDSNALAVKPAFARRHAVRSDRRPRDVRGTVADRRAAGVPDALRGARRAAQRLRAAQARQGAADGDRPPVRRARRRAASTSPRSSRPTASSPADRYVVLARPARRVRLPARRADHQPRGARQGTAPPAAADRRGQPQAHHEGDAGDERGGPARKRDAGRRRRRVPARSRA